MLVIHLIATAFMAGLIVFVQVVHYPLMALVGEGSFVPYEQAHTARTGWVVIPPMMAELASAVWIFASAPSQDVRAMALSGLLLLAVIWTSTAVFQAPAHGRLMRGFDGDAHRSARADQLDPDGRLGRARAARGRPGRLRVEAP